MRKGGFLVLTRRVDGAGRLAAVEWSFAGVERVVRYDYDSHSRLEQASFGLMNQPPQVSAGYHWLPGTRRVERLERPIAGSAQPLTGVFTHDAAGRLETLEWRRGGTLYGSHEYGFDAAGRRQTETRQDGATLHYAYTPRGELAHVERRRADGSLRPDWTHGYAYDESGNRAATGTPEGEHLIHEIEAPAQGGSHAWQLTTRREAPGTHGASKHWLRGRAHPQAEIRVNVKAHMHLEGGLAQREGPLWRHLHTVQEDQHDHDLIITASRPDLGQSAPPPVTREHKLKPAWAAFQTDRQGNMNGDGAKWWYAWNAENQLRLMYRIDEPPQADGDMRAFRHEILFTYDGLGRRVGKRARGYWMTTGNYGNWLYDEETLFLWDGWTLLAEFVRTEENGPWHLRRGYLWGLDLSGSLEGAGGVGGLLWVVEHTPGRAESHRQLAPWYDGNGNVMGWVENEAAYTLPLWRLEYDPYGRLLVEDPVRVVRHHKHRTLGIEEKWLRRPPSGFSTKYEDAETGLLYYGFRYYSPELGRWLNRDPIEEQGGVNLYGMVGNDPMNFVDINGRIGWGPTSMPPGFNPITGAPLIQIQPGEDRFPKLIEAVKQQHIKDINKWISKNCGKNPFIGPSRRFAVVARGPDAPPWPIPEEVNPLYPTTFVNDNQFGDRAQNNEHFLSEANSYGLGSFAIDIETPVSINYDEYGSSIIYKWKAVMYLEDNVGDLLYFGEIRKKLSKWNISGNGSCCKQ